jgi:GNAT superfamily N-acetyltransferase
MEHRLDIVEIAAGQMPSRPEQVSDQELRERATLSSKGRHTRHYIAFECGAEVAFLSLDVIPGAEYFVLYEIFVPQRLRRNGIGSRLLKEVSAIARRGGYTKIALRPFPLEPGASAEMLKNWYKERGYSERAGCAEEFESTVSIG